MPMHLKNLDKMEKNYKSELLKLTSEEDRKLSNHFQIFLGSDDFKDKFVLNLGWTFIYPVDGLWKKW